MEKVYLARHNKVWQKIGTDKPLTDKLTLKDGERLTDYQQISKPKERLGLKDQPESKEQLRTQREKKSDYFNTGKNDDSEGDN